MSLRRRDFLAQSGTLRGIVFDLPEVGDRIPKHRHGAEGGHLSVVAFGKVAVRTTGQPDAVHEAGAVIDWPAGTEHEWEAVEAPARVVNIFRYGTGS